MPTKKRARKGCERKRRFSTLKEAQRAAAALAANMKRKGLPIVTFLSAYACPNCKGFHFGSSNRIDWAAVEKITANPQKT